MEITLREPWNWQNHRDNKRTYSAKIVPETVSGDLLNTAIEEKYLIQSDVDFLHVDEETGKLFLPHSYLGEHGTTLEGLPLSITKEEAKNNVPCFAKIDWSEIYQSKENEVIKVQYSGPDIKLSKGMQLQGAVALGFLHRLLEKDFIHYIPSNVPMKYIRSNCAYAAKEPLRHIFISGMDPQNKNAVEFSFIPGDRVFSKQLSCLSNKSVLPQGLRLLSDVASAQCSILQENFYDTLLERFQADQENNQKPTVQSYTAAFLCSAPREPKDLIRAMLKNGYNCRNMEKALNSQENMFRERPDLLQQTLKVIKQPWVKHYLKNEQKNQGR